MLFYELTDIFPMPEIDIDALYKKDPTETDKAQSTK
jgi:hypothetical protein